MVGKKVKIKCIDAASTKFMERFIGEVGVVSYVNGNRVYVKLPSAEGLNNNIDYYWHRSSLIVLDTKLGRILYK